MHLLDLIRTRGPLTVAAFMEWALYDPDHGYYAGAVQRSGRAGDFFTSVDVGSIFGELLGGQIAEMADLLVAPDNPTPDGTTRPGSGDSPAAFQLVEVGAGNGRLSADIVRALRATRPALYERTRVHLVERSPMAVSAQRSVFGECADRLAPPSPALPESIDGVLVANELLDALPVHQVVMRAEGLREVYVDAQGDHLVPIEGAPSSPALAAYLERLDARLEPGWRVEINLNALDWLRDAARRLRRGFMVLIDYGHEARDLYSASHAGGTLTTFSRHLGAGPESSDAEVEPWLRAPGGQDLTTHVDFTSLRRTALEEGLEELGFLDQTYFLMGLLDLDVQPELSLRRRLALKTLLLPGGLGSTMKVLVLGKNVGRPALRGLSYRVRAT